MYEYPVVKEYPRVGSMLFTMVDPHRGHEVAYNRWYERDHFYAGCMVGPWLFAGRRWVATRPLKDLRFPDDSPIASPVQAGSYVSIYWHLEGHRENHGRWASPQVHWLYANGRGFPERTHVHTLIYTHDWRHHRDADPVPLELSLDHNFAGLAAVIVKREPAVDRGAVERWLREEYLPGWFEGSPVASCSAWSPVPQPEGGSGAPMHLPRLEDPERVTTLLFFLDADPRECWDRFVRLGADFDRSGLGRVIFATPFIPTVVGTDTYTDQLW
jgi:hypothetical protein